METPVTGKPFGLALCKHFGLDSRKVAQDYKLHTGVDEIFSVTLNITLVAEDIKAIGKLMVDE